MLKKTDESQAFKPKSRTLWVFVTFWKQYSKNRKGRYTETINILCVKPSFNCGFIHVASHASNVAIEQSEKVLRIGTHNRDRLDNINLYGPRKNLLNKELDCCWEGHWDILFKPLPININQIIKEMQNGLMHQEKSAHS